MEEGEAGGGRGSSQVEGGVPLQEACQLRPVRQLDGGVGGVAAALQELRVRRAAHTRYSLQTDSHGFPGLQADSDPDEMLVRAQKHHSRY